MKRLGAFSQLGLSLLFALAAGAVSSGCSTVKSIFAADNKAEPATPIQNPFVDYAGNGSGEDRNIVLRTRKGDRSVEVELPSNSGFVSDLEMPVSPVFKDQGRNPASDGAGDETGESGVKTAPGIADREIVRTFPKGSVEQESERADVERGLGVMTSDNDTPEADSSYLAAIDHVKRLFRGARYEAALQATDSLLRAYPTDPRIYQMRGTLYDRIGHSDLAFKSWNQALKLQPSNDSLRLFLERRQQKRGLASQPATKASAPESTEGTP